RHLLARLPSRRHPGTVDHRARIRLRRSHRTRRRDDPDDAPPWLPGHQRAGNVGATVLYAGLRLAEHRYCLVYRPARLTQSTASATVVTVVTFGGSGGRSTITTATPRAAAASSLGRVIAPPLFLVTRASMRWSRSKDISSSYWYGPRDNTIWWRRGSVSG